MNFLLIFKHEKANKRHSVTIRCVLLLIKYDHKKICFLDSLYLSLSHTYTYTDTLHTQTHTYIYMCIPARASHVSSHTEELWYKVTVCGRQSICSPSVLSPRTATYSKMQISSHELSIPVADNVYVNGCVHNKFLRLHWDWRYLRSKISDWLKVSRVLIPACSISRV